MLPFEIVDSTMLSTFRTCPRRFELAFVESLVPRGARNWHLHAGSAFADALHVARVQWANGNANWQEEGFKTLIQSVGPNEPPEKLRNKSFDALALAYVGYWERFPINSEPTLASTSGMPCAEFTFSLPLEVQHPLTKNPILYVGRADWIAEYRESLWVADEKTTGEMGPNWANQWPMRAQLQGYAYAARALGIPVTGSIVRGVRLHPVEPTFAEVHLPYSEWQLERWWELTNRLVEHMVRCWQDGWFDFALGDPCHAYGGCVFMELCQTRDITPWRETNFEVLPWNPLDKAKLTKGAL